MSKQMTAKFAGTCKGCGVAFAAGTRIVWAGRGQTFHVACDAPSIIVTRFSSGAEVYRNSRGRCIDAPCCGCCS